jgi:hypothetical protein
MPRAFAEVVLPEQGELRPTTVLVAQIENAHDVATFVAAPTSLPASLPEATPLQIRWGYEYGGQQNFYGYVHHVEPLYTEGDQHIKVVCIGASLPLRSALQRTWRYQSYDSIVREVAAYAFLSADVEPHDTIWPYVVSSGSAWDFLLGLAQKIGYVLTANGTEVKFISPGEVIQRGMTAAPLLDLDLFRPVMGLTVEDGLRRRQSFGLDQRSGRLFSTASGTPGYPVDLETGAVTASPGEASAVHAGLEWRNRFPHQADAEATGDATITQASLVYVQNVAADYVGQWYVHQVEHEINGGAYQCYLKLGRRTREPWPSFTRPGQPVRIRTDPYGEVTGNAPPSVLNNGVWRSGWARRAS